PNENYDLYIFDGWLPGTLPKGNMLIVNPPRDTELFKVGGNITDVGTVTVRPDDPRTRFLKFNDVNVAKYKQITNTPWADTLVSGPNGPLIVAGQYQDHRVAVLTF